MQYEYNQIWWMWMRHTMIYKMNDMKMNYEMNDLHGAKGVRIRSYSGPHFSRIFPHSDWIRRDTPYLFVFSPNAGKSGKNADQNNSEYGLFLSREALVTHKVQLNLKKNFSMMFKPCFFVFFTFGKSNSRLLYRWIFSCIPHFSADILIFGANIRILKTSQNGTLFLIQFSVWT